MCCIFLAGKLAMVFGKPLRRLDTARKVSFGELSNGPALKSFASNHG